MIEKDHCLGQSDDLSQNTKNLFDPCYSVYKKLGETKMKNIEKSREPVIVAAARTPVGKAKRGSLATTRPEDMMAAVIQDLLKLSLITPPMPERLLTLAEQRW